MINKTQIRYGVHIFLPAVPSDVEAAIVNGRGAPVEGHVTATTNTTLSFPSVVV